MEIAVTTEDNFYLFLTWLKRNQAKVFKDIIIFFYQDKKSTFVPR